MVVKQIYELMNGVTTELLGKGNVVNEDLSNVVDVGRELFDNASVDAYVKSLVNRIGRVIFVNRPYSGNVPSVLMDSWEFGSVTQKIDAEMPDATENESWGLTDKTEYNPNIFYQPKVTSKFFNNKVTFEIPMSFTERQVKQSFNSANELNAFISMIYNAVDKSFTVKIDGLIMRTINNMIAETLAVETANIRAVNLLKDYNTLTGLTLTADKALTDKEFIRYASKTMTVYADRMGKLSTLFNVGGKARFTSKDYLKGVMLSDFKASIDAYALADIRHNEYITFPACDIVPFWQGSGTGYDFTSVSSINVVTSGGKTVTQSGILAVLFDKEALGVTNLDKTVTTSYNAKGEFFNNFYKMDCGSFNDLNENFVVFFIKDTP